MVASSAFKKDMGKSVVSKPNPEMRKKDMGKIGRFQTKLKIDGKP